MEADPLLEIAEITDRAREVNETGMYYLVSGNSG
jgi:hypothetical protein